MKRIPAFIGCTILGAGLLSLHENGACSESDANSAGASYEIRKTKGSPDWAEIPELSLEHILWEPDCGVRAFGQFCYDDENLYVHLRAIEKNIRAENTAPLSPVCQDSCLEFFFMPAYGDRYFNFEINPNGCLYIGFGHGRYDSTAVYRSDMQKQFAIRTDRTNDGWGVYYQIPLNFIRIFYPEYEFSGLLKANVYKCGDLTKNRHYLAWNTVGTEMPDYHRPEFFGTMTFKP